jgi:hypothetical protein
LSPTRAADALQFTCLDTANEAAQLARGRVANYVDWFPRVKVVKFKTNPKPTENEK